MSAIIIAYPVLAAQNNAMRTNYIKTKSNNTLKKSESKFCVEKGETLNY